MQLSSWSCHSAVFSSLLDCSKWGSSLSRSLYSQGLWTMIKNPQQERFLAKHRTSPRGRAHSCPFDTQKASGVWSVGTKMCKQMQCNYHTVQEAQRAQKCHSQKKTLSCRKHLPGQQCPDPNTANTSGTSATSLQTELPREVSGCGNNLVLLHGDHSSGSCLTSESCALADLVTAAQGKELQEVSTLYRSRDEEQEINRIFKETTQTRN